jgi:hypothetical protein
MKKQDKTGEIHITNEGYIVKIIQYFNALNCTIQFEDETILKNLYYCNVKNGNVKNPYHKSICNIGFIGVGKYSYKTHLKVHGIWQSMLQRCYDKKAQEKRPTYKGCSVDERWHNFQNFVKWFGENWKSYMNTNWHLDKDILVKGNKVYSPETCAFVPQEINKLFIKKQNKRGEYPTGVYKIGNRFGAQISSKNKKIHLGYFSTPEEAFKAYKDYKEEQIKEIAQKYKNQITEKTYQALVNYQVEITD